MKPRPKNFLLPKKLREYSEKNDIQIGVVCSKIAIWCRHLGTQINDVNFIQEGPFINVGLCCNEQNDFIIDAFHQIKYKGVLINDLKDLKKIY